MVELAADYAASKRTGCLEVQYGLLRGEIYLQFGQIIQAEFEGKKGQEALYELLRLEAACVLWHEGLAPMYVGMTLDYSDVLKALGKSPSNGNGASQGKDPAHAEGDAKKNTRSLRPATPRTLHVPAGTQAALEEELSSYSEKYVIELSWINCPLPEPVVFFLEDSHQACYLAGRSPGCQVCVEDESVDPIHCSLLVHENMAEVWDLGTDRRTSLNGRVIERATLEVGDILTLGNVGLKYGLLLRRAPAGGRSNVRNTSQVVHAAERIPAGPITVRALQHGLKFRTQNLHDHAIRGFFSKMFHGHKEASVLTQRNLKTFNGTTPEGVS